MLQNNRECKKHVYSCSKKIQQTVMAYMETADEAKDAICDFDGVFVKTAVPPYPIEELMLNLASWSSNNFGR